MMREAPLIVHVVYRFGVGGLENGIVNLVNRMPGERWRHAIIALTEVSGRFAERIQRPDMRYVELGKRPGHLVRDYPRLYRLFRDLRPAVVHTRNLAALEAAVPAWAAGVPVRIHGEHGWDMADPYGLRRRYRLVRRAYRPFVNHYVALSRHLREYLERAVGIAPQRISQMYNGVDTECFRPAEARAPIAGCPFAAPGEWLIGWVGRMEAVKDPLNLALAFVRARLRAPELMNCARLILIGEGALRDSLQKLFARHGLRDQVWLPGERADVADILRGLDCFVLPSLAEGVSNTLLEAMASRLPIVATRVGGNAELIEPGMTGTLVPPSNPDALAEAIIGYARDRATARRHARAARKAAESRFSLGRMVLDYESLYARALGGVPGYASCAASRA